jgi:5-hydroxyisourate hydrolase
MAAGPAKPPITCHVLDTTIGRPGAGIPVTLTLHSSPSSSTAATTPTQYTAHTNADGRVTAWTPSSSAVAPLADVFARPGAQAWSLSFETGAYFAERGVEAFFPEVVVRFRVPEGASEKGEHFHVPVLAGPFGYTTYRGS